MSCDKPDVEIEKSEDKSPALTLDYSSHKLPEGIKWITNEKEPIIGSPNAKKGGTLHSFMLSFPLTFRTIGPDANSGAIIF